MMLTGARFIVGVIIRPLKTMGEVARAKPVLWAILLYLSLPALMEGVERFAFPEEQSLWGLFANRDFNMAVRMDTLPMVLPFLFVIGILVFSSARIFKGNGSFAGTMCTYAYSLVPLYLIIPLIFIANSIILGWPIDYSFYGIYLWHAVLVFLSVRETHGLKVSLSIYVCLLTLLFAVILALLIGFAYYYFFWEPEQLVLDVVGSVDVF